MAITSSPSPSFLLASLNCTTISYTAEPPCSVIRVQISKTSESERLVRIQAILKRCARYRLVTRVYYCCKQSKTARNDHGKFSVPCYYNFSVIVIYSDNHHSRLFCIFRLRTHNILSVTTKKILVFFISLHRPCLLHPSTPLKITKASSSPLPALYSPVYFSFPMLQLLFRLQFARTFEVMRFGGSVLGIAPSV